MAFVHYVITPCLRHYLNWELTPLRKFICANFICVVATAIACGLEVARKLSPFLLHPDGSIWYNAREVPMHELSVWALLPQYYFVALAEAFALVAGIEYFYREMPEMLRAIGQGINQLGNAFSSIFEIILLAIVSPFNWIPDNLDNGNLENYYLLLMTLSGLAGFWGIYCDYMYQKSGGSYAEVQRARHEHLARKNHEVGAIGASSNSLEDGDADTSSPLKGTEKL